MDISKEPPQQHYASSPVWEDLINDFLEMACFLSQEERSYLVRKLAKEAIHADEIFTLPTFSIEKRLISICENVSPEECWLYFPKEKKIEKMTR